MRKWEQAPTTVKYESIKQANFLRLHHVRWQNALVVNADLGCLSVSVHSVSFRNITSLKLDWMDQLCMENTTITPCAAFPSLYTTMFLAEAAASLGDWWEEIHGWKGAPELLLRSKTTVNKPLVPVEFSTFINTCQLRMSITHSKNPCVGRLSIIRAVLCKFLLIAVLV